MHQRAEGEGAAAGINQMKQAAGADGAVLQAARC